ncbi:MAG: FKBP-type peptidyl-prolyl cis-trans isomerase [Chromatiales bacterium]|nr:FKBP-type peptidyl-prolyl cis-trans isomerase [Chromatiales bacterium]
MRLNLFVLMASSVAVAIPANAAQPQPGTEDEKALYALGVILSRNLQPFGLSATELAMVQAGLVDGAQDKVTLKDPDAYIPKLQALEKTRSAAGAEREKAAGAAYLARAAAEKGATKTASGLVIRTLVPGTGAMPTARDQVRVHYEGKLVDGTVFDSSIERKEPATFPLTGVIPCWTEAVQLMKVGGKSQVVCPSALAYGDAGRPPQIPGGATLVFQVELLGIVTAGDSR